MCLVRPQFQLVRAAGRRGPAQGLFSLSSGRWVRKHAHVPDCLSFTVDLIQAKHFGVLKMCIFSHGTFGTLSVQCNSRKEANGTSGLL